MERIILYRLKIVDIDKYRQEEKEQSELFKKLCDLIYFMKRIFQDFLN